MEELHNVVQTLRQGLEESEACASQLREACALRGESPETEEAISQRLVLRLAELHAQELQDVVQQEEQLHDVVQVLNKSSVNEARESQIREACAL